MADRRWPHVGRLNGNVLQMISETLQQEPHVLLAFLFGSQASGRARPDSDVDLAVYLDLPPQEDALYQEITRLLRRLETLLEADVDLIILNTAAPAIAAEALQGKKLVMKDERLYLDLLCEKTREAEDLREWTFDLLRLRRRFREEGQDDAPSPQPTA